MKESKSNGLENIISQAIEEMKSAQGNNYSLERINLAELERRTGISRTKLRRHKDNNFNQKAHGLVGQKQQTTVLSGYSAYLDKLLHQGITNSAVCLGRLREFGFEGIVCNSRLIKIPRIPDSIATGIYLSATIREYCFIPANSIQAVVRFDTYNQMAALPLIGQYSVPHAFICFYGMAECTSAAEICI